MIFGVGFLLTYTQPPLILYGTRTVIVLVYIVLMLPFATRMQMTAMLSLGNAYTEASATSGAPPIVTTTEITLAADASHHPQRSRADVHSAHTRVRGVAAGARFDDPGHGHPALRHVAERFVSEVAAMALLMTAVTGVGVASAMLVGGRNVLSNL